MVERFRQLNMEPAESSTPGSTTAFIKSEIDKWHAVVKLAGAKVE